jgi:hypothetical protein
VSFSLSGGLAEAELLTKSVGEKGGEERRIIKRRGKGIRV